jgi:hypothetical protein
MFIWDERCMSFLYTLECPNLRARRERLAEGANVGVRDDFCGEDGGIDVRSEGVLTGDGEGLDAREGSVEKQ